jgi:hypothetical protein
MVSKKQRVIFLMPPKTASNSLSDCLENSEIEFEEFPTNKIPSIHLYLSELAGLHQIDNLDEYKIIQLVRDPAQRFASCYFHQMRSLKGLETNIDGMSLEEFAEHFKDCITKDGNFLKRFFGRLDFMARAIKTGKSWGTSRLLLAQNQWNDVGASVHCLKLEKLSNDITPLADILGVELSDLKKKNTNKKESNYDEILTPEVREIVKEIYAKDYKLFKY